MVDKISFLFFNLLLLMGCGLRNLDERNVCECNNDRLLYLRDTLEDYNQCYKYIDSCSYIKDSATYLQSQFYCLVMIDSFNRADKIYPLIKNSKEFLPCFKFALIFYDVYLGENNLYKILIEGPKLDSAYLTKFYSKISYMYMEANDYESALYNINRAIECDYTHLRVGYYNFNKSIILYNLGRFNSSLSCINIAISTLNERLDDSYLSKAVLLYKLNQKDSCLYYFDKALKENNKNSEIFMTRGKYYISELNDTSSACTDFNSALSLGDSSAVDYIKIICTYNDNFK